MQALQEHAWLSGNRVGHDLARGDDPLWGRLLHPELRGDGVGGPKPDTAYLSGKPVRVLRHDLHGLMAVGFENANGSCGSDAMGVQEDHDLPNGLLFRPARRNPGGAQGTYARDLLETVGSGLDNVEGGLTKGRNDPLRHRRADPAHLARG